MSFYRILYIFLFLLINLSVFGQEIPKSQSLLDVYILSQDSMQGRRTGEEGAAMARSYLTQRFLELGLQAFGDSYNQDFDFKSRRGVDYTGTNLVGHLPGKQEKYIVISAHYDHEGVKNDQIYNGADDNASGVAGLLAIAEMVSQGGFNYSFIFCAFDAEELGLQGAKSFVSNPPVPLKDIVFTLNMDMISHNDENEIYASGSYHNKFLIPLLEKVNSQTKVNVKLGHDKPSEGYNDWTFSSDHGPFHKKGIPFIYFGVEDHKDYHRPTDVYANINEEFFLDVIDVLILTIKELDASLEEKSE